jgi:hypothetical protein
MSDSTVTVCCSSLSSSGALNLSVPGALVAEVIQSVLSSNMRLRPKSHRRGIPSSSMRTLSYQMYCLKGVRCKNNTNRLTVFRSPCTIKGCNPRMQKAKQTKQTPFRLQSYHVGNVAHEQYRVPRISVRQYFPQRDSDVMSLQQVFNFGNNCTLSQEI